MRRLNLVILIAALFAVSLGTNAQKKDGKNIGGIRFGYHSAAMYDNGDMLPGTERHQNFYIRVFRDNKIIPMLSFGTGLEYFQIGAGISF